MIDIRPFFALERTLFCEYATNLTAKKVIYLISHLSHRTNPDVRVSYSARILSNREKLGSTYVGHGIAIPHGRVKDLTQPIISLIKLKSPILYSPKDPELSRLFFGLLIPETTDKEDSHVATLAALAEQLKNDQYRHSLEQAPDTKTLYQAAINIHI